MQAIARVNRVYPGKEGGLVVDYIGVGKDLKEALKSYTESGGRGRPTFSQDEAVRIMKEKYEVVRDMFYGFDYKKFFDIEPNQRVSFIYSAMEHILKEEGKKERFLRECTALLKAFSLSVPRNEAMEIKEEVGFFQAIKSALNKTTETKKREEERFEDAIKQILSKAVISDRIIDVFEAAGTQKPEISILSDGFLEEVKEMPQKNLAYETLKKLLNDEIKIMSKKNKIQAKSFRDLLEKTINEYTNRSIDAAQVVEEMVKLARKVRAERDRGKQLNMSDEEIAFYDALRVSNSAVEVLEDETLKKIAFEITEMIRNSRTIDWTRRESVQAGIRLKVKRILRKYGYPPEEEKKVAEMILEQAKSLNEVMAEA